MSPGALRGDPVSDLYLRSSGLRHERRRHDRPFPSSSCTPACEARSTRRSSRVGPQQRGWPLPSTIASLTTRDARIAELRSHHLRLFECSDDPSGGQVRRRRYRVSRCVAWNLESPADVWRITLRGVRQQISRRDRVQREKTSHGMVGRRRMAHDRGGFGATVDWAAFPSINRSTASGCHPVNDAQAVPPKAGIATDARMMTWRTSTRASRQHNLVYLAEVPRS